MSIDVSFTIPDWLIVAALVYAVIGLLLLIPQAIVMGGYIYPYQPPRAGLRQIVRTPQYVPLWVLAWPLAVWTVVDDTREHGWMPTRPRR